MENNPKLYSVLKIILEKLKNVNYALIGSVNLYLQGIKIEPQDVDILTTPEDIIKIDNVLQNYRIKEIYFDETEGRNSYRSFYKIKDTEIEVLGDVNNDCRDLKSLDRKIEVTFDEMNFPCILLTDELRTYQKMGRIDKVKLIEEFLQRQDSY